MAHQGFSLYATGLKTWKASVGGLRGSTGDLTTNANQVPQETEPTKSLCFRFPFPRQAYGGKRETANFNDETSRQPLPIKITGHGEVESVTPVCHPWRKKIGV